MISLKVSGKLELFYFVYTSIGITIQIQYTYEYDENCSDEISLNTTGGWLLKNSNVKENDGIYKGNNVINKVRSTHF